MSIKSHIVDPATGLKAQVVKGTETNSLSVATNPLKTFYNQILFFTDENGSVDMNIGTAYGATPEGVYDGADKSQWTASTIVGDAGDFVHDQANEHAKDAVVTVIDWTALALDTITIDISLNAAASAQTILTEGADWDNEVNNDTTAENIRAALHAITGVTATRSSAIVTIIADLNYDITSLTTSANITTEMSATAQAEDATGAENNEVAQFAHTGDFDTSSYTAITGWVYFTKWKDEAWDIYGWDVSEGTIVGNAVNIANYVSPNTLNVWLKFTIPLSDMGLSSVTTGFDALRIKVVKRDSNFFLDYVEIQEAGTVDPTEYFITPEKETWLHVHSFTISIADALAGTLADGTMPGLSYNKLLGEDELSNGIVYNRVQDGVNQQTVVLKNISDLLSWSGSSIKNHMSDGTNTFISIEYVFTEPVILKPEDDDKLRILIADSLSGILLMRMSVGAKYENRNLVY